jgi:CDP-diacylglycerol--glycerol-3-phosphate 3-phosphatidyltransferase
MIAALTRDLRTAPNLLSLSRIALGGAGLSLYAAGGHGPGLALVTVAAVTDYLDGTVARRTGQVTALGDTLDKLADLLLETGGLVLVVVLGLLSPFVLMAYLTRELVVSAARQHAGRLAPSYWGKLKSVFIQFALACLLLAHAASIALLANVAVAAFGFGLAASYLSGYGYLRKFARAYNQEASRG